jgi:probable rRNA maturation factor
MMVWTEEKLHALAKKLLKRLDVTGAALDIFLLKDADITVLKARFIKKKTEPNVLSFREPIAFPHPEQGRTRYLGEVYLNKDILRREPLRAAPLLLHGILHLLGHDHERDADAKKMEGIEKKVLGALIAARKTPKKRTVQRK